MVDVNKIEKVKYDFFVRKMSTSDISLKYKISKSRVNAILNYPPVKHCKTHDYYYLTSCFKCKKEEPRNKFLEIVKKDKNLRSEIAKIKKMSSRDDESVAIKRLFAQMLKRRYKLSYSLISEIMGKKGHSSVINYFK